MKVKERNMIEGMNKFIHFCNWIRQGDFFNGSYTFPDFIMDIDWNCPFRKISDLWAKCIYNNENNNYVVIDFYKELDSNNRVKLLEWICNHYDIEPKLKLYEDKDEAKESKNDKQISKIYKGNELIYSAPKAKIINLFNKPTEELIKEFSNHSQDYFCKELERIKKCCQKYFDDNNYKYNPIDAFIMLYCLDGDKEKTFEKLKEYLEPIPELYYAKEGQVMFILLQLNDIIKSERENGGMIIM